ncbi:BRO1 domain-containing protein BROX isoform X2 [Hemitrygon akajei]|uniref:BRO1 domain-containing protein BROX isoform X2 n=1 Tax=Hemitrygon akajei TaxID=2704970 RepID=UPI003BF9A42F
MTHWFHRNPLKATAPVSFNFYGVATNNAAAKICNDLRSTRMKLLELFLDVNCNMEMMKNAVDAYFSLLQGFITSLDGTTQENKLRFIQNFKWTDTLQGNIASAQQDAIFDLVSVEFNVALWHTKYASRLAGKEDITVDEAKEVHRSLKTAAGIFKHIKENEVAKLVTAPEKGKDLESRVLDTYIVQCQAEAQEVTIARAIELKHNPGLIAALAYETANFYQKADYSKAETLCKEYGQTKGPGSTAKPSEHLFFRKLGTYVRNTLEKCQRENGFIYFQKVPPEAPQLELKASYGLVEPQMFELPALAAAWNQELYAAFDITKGPKDDKAKVKEEEVKPMKEPDLKPQKDTGCSIS